MTGTSQRWTVGLVDDEPAALRYLQKLLACREHCEVVFQATSGHSAVEKIRQHRPDILFLDIEMPDMNGIAVAKATLSIDYYLIFLTAYDHYALNAFDVHANDYLIKPIRQKTLLRALEKISSMDRMISRRSDNQTVKVGSGNSFRIVKVADILYVEAIGRYRMIHLTDEGAKAHKMEVLISETTIRDWEISLPDNEFTRIHRKYLINRGFISGFTSHSRCRFVLLGPRGIELPISRSRVNAVMTKEGLA